MNNQRGVFKNLQKRFSTLLLFQCKPEGFQDNFIFPQNTGRYAHADFASGDGFVQ